METQDRAANVRGLRRGIELGMTHIDTAEMYGSGAVEEVVGEAIAGVRDKVFLATKVLPSNASYDGTIAACEKSLRRLRTDYIDLYLLHWPSQHPVAETIKAFEHLKQQGKIKQYGVSNFDTDQMKEAVAIAGPNAIICNQVLYHLEQRAIEHTLLPWCDAHHVTMVAYSPLSAGHFVRPSSPGGAVLEKIAKQHSTTAAQVALAFLLRRPGSAVIPKASSIEHVEQNAKAADLVLDPAELAEIEKAFPLGPKRALPML